MYRHWYLCPVYHCRVRVICTLYIMRIHKRNEKKKSSYYTLNFFGKRDKLRVEMLILCVSPVI